MSSEKYAYWGRFARIVPAMVILGLMFSLWVTVFELSTFPGFYDGLGDFYGGDFINFWGAPRIVHDNFAALFDVDQYSNALSQIHGATLSAHIWSYPLHFLLLLEPLRLLPLMPAFAVWSALGLAIFGYYTYRLTCAPYRFIGLFAALLSPASWMCLLDGQNGLLLAGGALGVLWLLERNRSISAGLILGLLTIKPHLFLLWPLMLLIDRQWKCIAAAIASCTTILSLSVAIYGMDAWHAYADKLAPIQWRFVTDPELFSPIQVYQTEMPSLLPALMLLHIPPAIALPIAMCEALGITILCFVALRRTRNIANRLLLLACGGLLVSPYSFNYDMPLLTAALLIYGLQKTYVGIAKIGLFGLVYLIPTLVCLLNVIGLPLSPVILMTLFMTIVLDVLKHQASSTPAPPSPR